MLAAMCLSRLEPALPRARVEARCRCAAVWAVLYLSALLMLAADRQAGLSLSEAVQPQVTVARARFHSRQELHLAVRVARSALRQGVATADQEDLPRSRQAVQWVLLVQAARLPSVQEAEQLAVH